MTKKSKKTMRHPPKDKKINRPRPLPVQPLTDEELLSRSCREFAKSEMHLAESKILQQVALIRIHATCCSLLFAHIFFAKPLRTFARHALATNGSTPHACVHSAYYAMHHCARAALFKSGGVGKSRDVPESHEHVIQHFGRLEDASGKVGGLGMMLNRARGERVASDYDLDDEVTDEQASETAADAVHFVEQCRKLWNLESLD